MKYRLPVTVAAMEGGGFMARCEQVRATATGESPRAAVDHLREAIEEMVGEFGEKAVFQDIQTNGDLQIIEVAV